MTLDFPGRVGGGPGRGRPSMQRVSGTLTPEIIWADLQIEGGVQ
jgi:hypothetical protein